MDLIFDISGLTGEEEKFGSSKRDVLKFLKMIGVDTRFISYTPDKVYINNLRFSKFSRKREATFKSNIPKLRLSAISCSKRFVPSHPKHCPMKSSPIHEF
jgi:hypothetical protein